MFTLSFFLALLAIIWVDLLLSGDNAVVIAMVCRQLPKNQQRLGMIFGTTAAIGLRVVLAFIASSLLAVPYLSTAAGLFLVWVAIKMIAPPDEGEGGVKASTTLWGAVGLIAAADAGMSLDNVLAIAALAQGSMVLMALGVLISIPMVIAGSAIMLSLLDRFPQLVWAGAALLGWVAGGIMAHDLHMIPGADDWRLPYLLSGATLGVTLLIGSWRTRRLATA